MRALKISQNYEVILDDDWYEMLKEVDWIVRKCGNSVYAACFTGTATVYCAEFMHNVILDRNKIDCSNNSIVTDHINGDGLDNRGFNLRIASKALNSVNSRKRKNCSSIYKGVSLRKNILTRKWRSDIVYNGKQINLGNFEKEIDAARAYNEKAVELYGNKVIINNL